MTIQEFIDCMNSGAVIEGQSDAHLMICLLYTSDAADD